ncbi:MAG TPA: hypothetical protein VKB59_15460 [Micromonosporaceae bacterium]|nr:hypothetical protein [Micromonosporaceae bacterium]
MEPRPDYAFELEAVELEAIEGIEQETSWARPLVLVPAFATLALIGGLFPSFSVAANLYVLVLGAALMWLGLANRTAKRASPWRLGRAAGWWLLPAGIFVAIELVNFLYGSTYAHPTFSVLVAEPLAHYPVRSLAYFVWLGGFWGLVRR